jgi:hypothetical protein
MDSECFETSEFILAAEIEPEPSSAFSTNRSEAENWVMAF